MLQGSIVFLKHFVMFNINRYVAIKEVPNMYMSEPMSGYKTKWIKSNYPFRSVFSKTWRVSTGSYILTTIQALNDKHGNLPHRAT